MTSAATRSLSSRMIGSSRPGGVAGSRGDAAGSDLIFFRTRLGRVFSATSDDPATLEPMGRDARAVFAMPKGFALAVAGMAALFLATRATLNPSAGPARRLGNGAAAGPA